MASIRRPPIRAAIVWCGCLLAIAALVIGGRPAGRASAVGLDPGVVGDACSTTNPYVVVSRFADPKERGFLDAPAVVAVRYAPEGAAPQLIPLASQGKVGAVYGLAYQPERGELFAGGYLRRGVPFGPAGPGAIYRVDVASGDVSVFASAPAGPDHHDLQRNEDEAAAEWVGRSALGDLDLSNDGTQLFAMDLYDGYIYRYAVPGGQLLGKFRNGAAGTAHAADLWPFALTYEGGWLYHAVVDVSEEATAEGSAVGLIYRSLADGSDMRLVARFDTTMSPGSAPMIVDLAVRSDGALLVDMASRNVDGLLGPSDDPAGLVSAGGLLAVTPGGDGSDPGKARVDNLGVPLTPSGGLGTLPGTRLLALPTLEEQWSPEPTEPTGGTPAPRPIRLRLLWVEGVTGDVARSSILVDGADATRAYLTAGAGDVEVLCAFVPALDPQLGATATREAQDRGTAAAIEQGTSAAGTATAAVPTLTAQAIVAPQTATAAAATATVALAHSRVPADSLAAFARACTDGDPYYAVPIMGSGLKAALSVSGYPDIKVKTVAPHVVAFNTAGVRSLVDGLGAVYGLAYDWRRGHIYAASYFTSYSAPGPGGPGVIYRIDLNSGAVAPWAWANTGPDWTKSEPAAVERASPLVGAAGFGDIDLSSDGTMLFAVDLYDGRIYRYSVPDGRYIGAFANGGTRESWSANARPMGLGFRDGVLYHGVVNSGVVGSAPLEAVVYASEADGSQMRVAGRLALSYRSPRWARWFTQGVYWAVLYDTQRQAMFADIDWTSDGHMVIGLRDRSGDAGWGGGDGDLLWATLDGYGSVPDVWRTLDRQGRRSSGVFGSLVADPLANRMVGTGWDKTSKETAGGAWFDNQTARRTAETDIYSGDTWRGRPAGTKPGSFMEVMDLVSLGDIAVLCPPAATVPTPTASDTSTPTSTPTPPATPTGTATSSPSPTVTGTCTPTWTSTPMPQPLYLPLVYRESCKPEQRHADVVLVLDLSTSMRRESAADGTKLDAALGAARLFVNLVDLDPDAYGGFDRVGVVGFNDVAWTEVGLSNDRPALQRALDALPAKVAEGTRLDLAIDQGQETLAASPRVGVAPVMALLTDGLPNRVPLGPGGTQEETVVARASAAKASGTRIFTVGLGLPDDVLRGLLAQVASSPTDYYYAPDGADLTGIYRQIAGRITECP